MTIETRNGNFSGSRKACIDWLNNIQPAFAAVVVNGDRFVLDSQLDDWSLAIDKALEE